jgi:hypothetical protein
MFSCISSYDQKIRKVDNSWSRSAISGIIGLTLSWVIAPPMESSSSSSASIASNVPACMLVNCLQPVRRASTLSNSRIFLAVTKLLPVVLVYAQFFKITQLAIAFPTLYYLFTFITPTPNNVNIIKRIICGSSI